VIKIMKGLRFGQRNMKSIYPESKVSSCIFEFRDKHFEIQNTEKWDVEPYLGCKLDKQVIKGLIQWLQECLAEKKCDYCWNIEIPEQFDISGDIKCKKCGEFYR